MSALLPILPGFFVTSEFVVEAVLLVVTVLSVGTPALLPDWHAVKLNVQAAARAVNNLNILTL
jgi:hypothetical protein